MVKRNQPAGSSYSERMRMAREAAGISYERAAYETHALLLPSQWVTSTTIRRLERTIPEDKADPILLWALSRVYGVPVEQLSRRAAQWIAENFRPSRAWNTAVEEAA